MTTPKIDPITGQPFNLLAYVPALGLCLMLAAGWASLRSDINASIMRDDAMSHRMTAFETGAQGREDRIRVLETAVTAMQTQLGYVAQGVDRIERNLGTIP